MENNLYRFVKASERLPNDFDVVILRMSDDYYKANFAKDRDGFLFQILETHEEFYEQTFHGIEWLGLVAEDNQQELWAEVQDKLEKFQLKYQAIEYLKSRFHLIPKQVK